MREIRLTTERRTQLIDITAHVREAVDGETGTAVLVYVPHTTAAVTINEKIDPALVARPRARVREDRRRRLGLAARRRGRPERPVARPRVGRGRAGADPAPRRRARARPLPGALPLRVRRAEAALGLRHRPAVDSRAASALGGLTGPPGRRAWRTTRAHPHPGWGRNPSALRIDPRRRRADALQRFRANSLHTCPAHGTGRAAGGAASPRVA